MSKKRSKKVVTAVKTTKAISNIATKNPGPQLKGKISGVGVKATWIQIFQKNEEKKLSDIKISELMHQNFPDRKSHTFDMPQIHRNLYNKGELTNGAVPKVKSERYAK